MPLPEDVTTWLADGKRLDDAQLAMLAGSPDVLALGALADQARRRRRGERVTFVRVCEVPVEAAAQGTIDPMPPAAGEVRIVGTPPSVELARRAARAAVAAAGGTPVTGFALEELDRISGGAAAGLSQLLGELRAAGLAGLVEICVDRMPSPEAALECVGRAGLFVGRAAVAHEDASTDRLGLIRRVSDWGPVGMIRSFAPIPRTSSRPLRSTGYDDVRQVALARLVVDNIDSIQVGWVLQGAKLGQVALTFGADDVDGVPAVDERALGPRRSTLEEVRRNILAAALAPAERDGCFEIVS